ncbi:hypothetical protein CEXT_711321 [Caerostris extrusa]|uniref:Uncharacterized protein n=1 Tax=Caerostris extrusa TaxID=172846 RepID=A0AAV4Y2E2_CAEEX|nr:hypothetical protein CEXT_711321 [Caerostris extrusa]
MHSLALGIHCATCDVNYYKVLLNTLLHQCENNLVKRSNPIHLFFFFFSIQQRLPEVSSSAVVAPIKGSGADMNLNYGQSNFLVTKLLYKVMDDEKFIGRNSLWRVESWVEFLRLGLLFTWVVGLLMHAVWFSPHKYSCLWATTGV